MDIKSDFVSISHSISDEKDSLEDAFERSSNMESRSKTPPLPQKLKKSNDKNPTTTSQQPQFSYPSQQYSAVTEKARQDTAKKIHKIAEKKQAINEGVVKTKLIKQINEFYELLIERKIITQEAYENEFFPNKLALKSPEELEQYKQNLKSMLNKSHRKEAIYKVIGWGSKVVETAAVNLEHPEYMGLSEVFNNPRYNEKVREIIKPEIDEIAIEHGDSLVPNAFVRLGMKLAEIVQGYGQRTIEISQEKQRNQNQTNPKNPPPTN